MKMRLVKNAFRDHKLGDLVSITTGKLDSNAAKPNGQYPFFTCSRETFRTDTYSFDCECVLLAGNNAAGIFPIKYYKGKFDAYQRTYIIRSKDEQRLINRFLFYLLQPKLEHLKSVSTGVATKFLTLTILRDLTLPIPSLDIQQKIAAILSAYDDLIENNLRRIKILEEMARTIYREWFIKFRFPGHEKVRTVDSPLGKIPEGWEVGTLNDVLSTIESGSRPKGGISPEIREIPSIGAENIIGLGKYDYFKEKFVTRDFFNNMKRGRIRSGDVLLYKDGAQIGRKSMFRDGFPHSECCINEHVFILRTNGRCSQTYLFFWLDQPEITQKIINLNANAAQPGINQAGVRSLPILLPPIHLLEKSEKILDPLLGAIFNYAKKNNILRQTRDLLLPKLISGEIDVSELDIKIPDTERS